MYGWVDVEVGVEGWMDGWVDREVGLVEIQPPSAFRHIEY